MHVIRDILHGCRIHKYFSFHTYLMITLNKLQRVRIANNITFIHEDYRNIRINKHFLFLVFCAI